MIKQNLLLFLIFYLAAIKVGGQSNSPTLKSINNIRSSDYPIYIENGNKLNLKTLTKSELSSLFKENENKLQKYKPASFWFYIDIGEIESEQFIEIYALLSTKISAFKINFGSEKSNNVEKLAITKHRNDFHLIRVNKSTKHILVNIRTNKYSGFEIKSFSKKYFFLKERKLNVYYGFIVGVFLLLALYHLVLYVKVLDRLYLYYIFQIIISGLLVAPHSGFFRITSFLYYDIVFISFQFSCIIISIKYLEIYSKYKKKIWLTFTIILLINLLGFIAPSTTSKYLSHFASLFIYLGIILLTSLKQFNKSDKPIKWFILPWASLLLVHIIYLLDLDIIFQYRQAIEIGLLANICLLALSIGYKLNIYKDQKSYAEAKELNALSERDRVIHDQNLILEQLINERNKKILERNTTLLEKKSELEKNNTVLKESSQRLRIINQELINKNNEISSQNQELKKHHELLEIIVNKRTKKLLEAKERAIVADKLKTSFLNNLTHEINTPMNAITGYANLLNDKNLTRKKRNDHLTQINKNVDILLESIDNVVILARIQAGILKPKLKQFDLNSLITHCNDYFSQKLKAQNKENILFKTNKINIQENALFYSDYEKLWQILYRLVENSIKFTQNGEILLTYELKDKMDGQYNFCMKVQDTGVGIKKEKLDFILERFLNIENDKTILYRGAGIGLAIVKGLIDILKGEATIHSQVNTGTSFQVEVPVMITESEN